MAVKPDLLQNRLISGLSESEIIAVDNSDGCSVADVVLEPAGDAAVESYDSVVGVDLRSLEAKAGRRRGIGEQRTPQQHQATAQGAR